MKWCAYSERCVSELDKKLESWGLSQKDKDRVIDELVEQDFLNEKRFANSYVRGKFNINKWGRHKIRMSMRATNIFEEEIESSLKKIDASEYRKTAQNLIERKHNDLRKVDERSRKSKIYYYMLSKGYESDIIFEILNETRG